MQFIKVASLKVWVCVLGSVLGLGSSLAVGQPVVPGFVVQDFVDTPPGSKLQEMTFNSEGTVLYVGEDDQGKIYRIELGPPPVVTLYGCDGMSDPDAPLFDATGEFCDPGGIIVGRNGVISCIQSNDDCDDICTGSWNPQDLAFDSAGSIVFSDLSSSAGVRSIDSECDVTTLPLDPISMAGPLAVASNDEVFVSTLVGKIIRVVPGGSASDCVTGLGQYVPMTFGQGGIWGEYLYAIDWYGDGSGDHGGELLRIDVDDGCSVTTIGTGFQGLSIIDIALGPEDVLYLAVRDVEGDKVMRIIDAESIPAVSEWGLVAMTLLVLSAGTLVYTRRRQVQA